MCRTGYMTLKRWVIKHKVPKKDRKSLTCGRDGNVALREWMMTWQPWQMKTKTQASEAEKKRSEWKDQTSANADRNDKGHSSVVFHTHWCLTDRLNDIMWRLGGLLPEVSLAEPPPRVSATFADWNDLISDWNLHLVWNIFEVRGPEEDPDPDWKVLFLWSDGQCQAPWKWLGPSCCSLIILEK